MKFIRNICVLILYLASPLILILIGIAFRMRTHEKSSGNVFTDLGLPNSKQELLKARLTVQIYKLIKEQNLTKTKAAELLGTTQAQVSALMRCRPVSISHRKGPRRSGTESCDNQLHRA